MDDVINVKEILERIKLVKGFHTQIEIARFLGVSKGTISNWLARNSVDFPLVISKLDGVDLNWLFTGIGMPQYTSAPCNNEQTNRKDSSKTSDVADDRSVTLYDVTAAANLKTLFANKNQYALGKIIIPNLPACDGAIYVSGDSMYPILKSGDIIGYKQIFNFNNVIFGEIYIVAFDLDGNEYLAVKYVNRSEKENCIRLVSYNNHHDPMDIPMDHINTMAIVKFMIRKNMII